MSKLVYVKDRFLDAEKATISIHDLNVQRGYGIFDFFRLVGNRPLHLEEHLDRFYFSAQQMRLPVPKSREDLKLVIKELIWENEIPDSGFRIQLTGGETQNGFSELHPILFVSQVQFAAASHETFHNGTKLVSYEHQRQLPQVKTVDYMMSIWLQPVLKHQAADELLYFSNGLIRESPRSNIFLITQDEKVVTPGEQILKGISRKKVLEIASRNYITEERDVRLEEIASAKEIFLTSTTKQILPVLQIDGRPVGDGRPGSITKKLSEQLNELCGFAKQNPD